MDTPQDLKYTKSHEWVRIEGDVAVVGITFHAVDQLGDLAFVDLPEVGQELALGDTFGEIESTKTVSELYAPISGEVLGINDELVENLQSLTDSPYEEGWLVRLRVADAKELNELYSAEEYDSFITEEEH